MFGLITRLAVMVSLPTFSFMKRANAGGVYQTAVNQYPNELIIGLCIVTVIVGCLASVVTPDPEGAKPTSTAAKFVYSIFASITALVYIVFYEKELSIVHAAWVGGVSFVAPAAIPSLKGLVFELVPITMNALKSLYQNFISKWTGSDKGNNHD